MPPAGSAELSAAAARRVALAAQGFLDPRPGGAAPDRRHLRRAVGRLGVLQIDAVNVLVRAHYLPLFSRLGRYPVSLLDRAAYADHELFEYWGHEASLLPVATQPLLRWRMERATVESWGRMARVAAERPAFVEQVVREVTDRGPVTATELAAHLEEDRPRRRGPWWDWSDVKSAVEFLFWSGQVTTASRTTSFERRYDLPERVLPAAVLASPTPTVEEAQRGLLRLAARSLGVATATDLGDYFRIRMPEARPRIAELVEAGELLAVSVRGWRSPAYLDPAARVPRRVPTRALVSPFDSLVWERDRVQRLFGTRVRLEIYVPADQRVHGYYVLPFLLGDRLVGRVDLKSDRATGVLRVLASYAEPDAPPDTAGQLVAELADLAGWLGLDRVEVAGRGDLAPALPAAFSSRT